MIKRFLKDSQQSCFLFGPRGTGKSTWLHAQYPEALYIDLLNPGIAYEYTIHPERLYSVVRRLSDNALIIIDEVQRVPQILSVVHGLIEEKRGWRFILTGSSSRKLKREGVDLLAGRAVLLTMHPFMAIETGADFSLDNALKIGLVPSVVMSADPQESLKSYVSIYVHEEVQAEALVRNLPAFGRFLEVLSFSHGSQINSTAIARECGVDRKSIDTWIGIIEDLLLGARISAFSKRAVRTTVTHPKFYFFDCGIYRSLRPSGPLDRPAEVDGSALEGLVYQHLNAWINYGRKDIRLYFWRSVNGAEVDFVLYGANCFGAIEVKNAARIRTEDLRNLKLFRKDFPEAICILLYRGQEQLLIEGIICLPCEMFLRALDPAHEFAGILENLKSTHHI